MFFQEHNQLRWERVCWQGLRRWYREPLGRSLLASELELLEDILPNLFGYHVLQLGLPCSADLLAASRIPHRHRLDWDPDPAVAAPDLLARPELLPIASDSVDVVLLPHTLECVAEPRAVLVEVDRVLIPEGHVVVLGFNPLSSWGARRLLSNGDAPWCSRFLGARQVSVWLAGQGYDRVDLYYGFYRPPFSSPALLQRLDWLEHLGGRGWLGGGAIYALILRKRVSTLTLIGPRWRLRRALVPQGIANRTSRKAVE
ncbi:MAG TPA: methyltransferase domain-containing protein [Candidatus Competibacteraceae bacterium]|nr:methyltransferase domain-containing protein [Candidatus Competibacteraceae bacterium]